MELLKTFVLVLMVVCCAALPVSICAYYRATERGTDER